MRSQRIFELRRLAASDGGILVYMRMARRPKGIVMGILGSK